MTPSEIKGMGHFLYITIFESYPNPTYTLLFKEHLKKMKEDEHPELFHVDALSGELCVERFAQMYRLNQPVLKRWTNTASIELANTHLPLFETEHERQRWIAEHAQIIAQSTSAIQATHEAMHEIYDQQIIKPTIAVSTLGIKATIGDHRALIRQAFYVDLDLGFKYGSYAR